MPSVRALVALCCAVVAGVLAEDNTRPATLQGSCELERLRFLDPTSPFHSQGWLEPKHAMSELLQQLDPAKYPIQEVELSSVACASGCCNITVFVRPRDTDGIVLLSLFSGREYRNFYDLDFKPRTVLDAGANIGLATVLFAQLFPEALIVSVEPENKNFDILKLNTARYGNVLRYNKGLWTRSIGLELKPRDGCTETSDLVGPCGSWGFSVQEAKDEGHAAMQAISAPDILRNLSLSHFDIVKIDIEGSEEQVMGSKPEWIMEARIVSMEVHFWISDKAKRAIFEHLESRFAKQQLGEYWVFKREADAAAVEDGQGHVHHAHRHAAHALDHGARLRSRLM